MESPDKRGWGTTIAREVDWLLKGSRRIPVALAISALVLTILKLKGGETPPTRGGWRELDPSELAEDPASNTAEVVPRTGTEAPVVPISDLPPAY